MDFKNFKGVIFDFDGTLADTMKMWSNIDYEFFKKRGKIVPEGYEKKIATMGFSQAAQYTKELLNLSQTPQEIIAEWYDLALFEHTYNIFLKKGAVDFVKKLRQMGLKTAIATASDTSLIFPALKNNNAENLFDAFAMTNEVTRRKGFPDVYDLARDRLGLKTEECVVFEDVLEAVKGAKMGNYITVGVFDDRSVDDAEKMKALCDKYIYSFEELL